MLTHVLVSLLSFEHTGTSRGQSRHGRVNGHYSQGGQ